MRTLLPASLQKCLSIDPDARCKKRALTEAFMIPHKMNLLALVHVILWYSPRAKMSSVRHTELPMAVLSSFSISGHCRQEPEVTSWAPFWDCAYIIGHIDVVSPLHTLFGHCKNSMVELMIWCNYTKIVLLYIETRMYSSRMRTARTVQGVSSDRNPLDREPPPPWTYKHLWKHNLRKLRLRAVTKLNEFRLNLEVDLHWLIANTKAMPFFGVRNNIQSMLSDLRMMDFPFSWLAHSSTFITISDGKLGWRNIYTDNYRPQRNCKGYVFTGICLSTWGVSAQCMLEYHAPRADTPPAQRPPEQAHPLEQTPPEQTPPGSRHPPEQTPPGADTLPGPDTPRADTPWTTTPWTTAPPGPDPPPGRHGHCCGRYASYWNAFLFKIYLQKHQYYVGQ